VFLGPDDLAIVQGDPSERRRFMDEAVRILWPARESTAGAYERVLRQRNRLLKDWGAGGGSGEPDELSAWDAELIAQGVALTRARAAAVGALRDLAGEEFRSLSGGSDEALVVRYQPSVEGEPLEAVFAERLASRRQDELIRRTTLVGPHRDDLGLVVEGLTARGFASHGEAWGAAVSLRLALAGAVSAEIGEEPITLLDDPFSGLDPERRRRLASRIGARGQVVITVPDEAQVPPASAVWCAEEAGIVSR
jgi:DNA replication and repair protein RecF